MKARWDCRATQTMQTHSSQNWWKVTKFCQGKCYFISCETLEYTCLENMGPYCFISCQSLDTMSDVCLQRLKARWKKVPVETWTTSLASPTSQSFSHHTDNQIVWCPLHCFCFQSTFFQCTGCWDVLFCCMSVQLMLKRAVLLYVCATDVKKGCSVVCLCNWC